MFFSRNKKGRRKAKITRHLTIFSPRLGCAGSDTTGLTNKRRVAGRVAALRAWGPPPVSAPSPRVLPSTPLAPHAEWDSDSDEKHSSRRAAKGPASMCTSRLGSRGEARAHLSWTWVSDRDILGPTGRGSRGRSHAGTWELFLPLPATS